MMILKRLGQWIGRKWKCRNHECANSHHVYHHLLTRRPAPWTSCSKPTPNPIIISNEVEQPTIYPGVGGILYGACESSRLVVGIVWSIVQHLDTVTLSCVFFGWEHGGKMFRAKKGLPGGLAISCLFWRKWLDRSTVVT